MNTEYLFGIYLARQRMNEAGRPARRAFDVAPAGATPDERARAASRERALQRLFDAVRSAVEDSHNRP